MLTLEQIKNLKPGDKLITNVHFRGLEKGYVCCTYSPRPADFEPKFYFDPASLLLPPKHDPCRLFRTGDVARVVERDGRKDAIHAVGELVTVVENDFGGTFISVKNKDGRAGSIAWCFIELVTPVEELEPYSVKDSSDRYMVIDEKGAVIVMFYKARHPHAKEAAEAERKRLNAEYRKEQDNG